MLLPDPDGPMIATISPRAISSDDAVERPHRRLAGAEDLGEVAGNQYGLVIAAV